MQKYLEAYAILALWVLAALLGLGSIVESGLCFFLTHEMIKGTLVLAFGLPLSAILGLFTYNYFIERTS